MPVSLILTPFYHFHFRPTSGLLSSQDLTYCHKRMQSHTDCICLTFLHCVLSDVSSNSLLQKKQSHIGCICLTPPHCGIENGPLKCLPQKTCLTFLYCLFLFHFFVVQDFDPSPASKMCCLLRNSRSKLRKNQDDKTYQPCMLRTERES